MNSNATYDLCKTKERFERSLSFLRKALFLLILFPLLLFSKDKYAFVTATDTEHYSWTLNLIAGIHRFHKEPHEIAVFDLGLTEKEKHHLHELAYVNVYEVEKTHPRILEKFVVNPEGKIARGLYSWKPVVLKQASEKFPYFFYVDSGISIKGPFTLLFAHLYENGSFFIDCGHTIDRMTTKTLREHFHLREKQNTWILKEPGLSAGFQGISPDLRESYIEPMYKLAFDLSYFQDDGSCPKGFGWARHDQALFSIQAKRLHLPVHKGQQINLQIDGKKKKVHLREFIKITRSDFDLQKAAVFLKYKTDLTSE